MSKTSEQRYDNAFQGGGGAIRWRKLQFGPGSNWLSDPDGWDLGHRLHCALVWRRSYGDRLPGTWQT